MKTKSMQINQALRKRVVNIADYLLANRATVRMAAKQFGVSKSTVHKDMSDRLKIIDPLRYQEVSKLLDYNGEIKYIRGGEATRIKYKGIKRG